MPDWNVWLECLIEMSDWNVWLKCMIKLSDWNVWLKCLIEMPDWNVWLKCLIEMSSCDLQAIRKGKVAHQPEEQQLRMTTLGCLSKLYIRQISVITILGTLKICWMLIVNRRLWLGNYKSLALGPLGCHVIPERQAYSCWNLCLMTKLTPIQTLNDPHDS